MSDQFVAEIRIVGFTFAPKGWAFCAGQLLPISQNTALFSVFGTIYGGDGKTNFALPNLQGQAPLARGQGPGLSLYDLGQSGGSQTVTLLQSEMPAHAHSAQATTADTSSATPGANTWGVPGPGRGLNIYDAALGPQMNANALTSTGGSQPHNNLPPYLALNFVVALQGIYPVRP